MSTLSRQSCKPSFVAQNLMFVTVAAFQVCRIEYLLLLVLTGDFLVVFALGLLHVYVHIMDLRESFAFKFC